MIKSIIFDGKKGYIGERYGKSDKPEKPNRDDYYFKKYTHGMERVVDEEKFQRSMEEYNNELSFYNAHKGEYKVACSELLVGRKFEFADDRINLIFGPNASGKTTILKGIASHALCEDGWSKFIEPINFDNDNPKKSLPSNIFKMCRTSNTVDWDGSPIYYHNFDGRREYGYIGDLTGSILGSLAEEMGYRMARDRFSKGQNMFYQISKLSKIMSKHVTYEDVLRPYKEKYGPGKANSCWSNCYQAQEDYFKSFPMAFDPNGQNTYLFDEIDKSMDILSIHLLYTKYLPDMMDKYGHQILIISHSPIVLRDEIYNSEKYNIISMDEEYTEKCKQLL